MNINLLHLAQPVFADLNNMAEDFGNAFSKPKDNPISFVILGVMIIAVAIGAYVYRKKTAKILRQTYHDVGQLFRELCKAHQFNRLETIAFKELVKVRKIEPPVKIFLLPDEWEIPPQHKELQNFAPTIAALKKRVFGQ